MSDLGPPTSTTTPLSPVDAVLFVLVILVSLTSGVYQGWFEAFGQKKRERRPSQTDENVASASASAAVAGATVQRRNSRGLALSSSTGHGEGGGSVLKDILFVLTCCMSVCLTAAVPINVYETGVAFAVTCIPAILTAHIVSLVIVVPVFRPQESPSTFEEDPDHNGNSHRKERFQVPRLHNYLRLRFRSTVLTCFAGLLVFLMWMIISTVVFYIVASILHQISNLSQTLSIVITIIIATLYTAAEGKSRLLWTDVIWSLLILVGLFVIFLVAVIESGGYRDLLDKARQVNAATLGSGQLNNGQFTPYVTHQESFIAIFIGQLVIWICVYSGFHAADSRFSTSLSSQMLVDKSGGVKSNRYGVVLFNLPFVIILLYLLLSIGIALIANPRPTICIPGQDNPWAGQILAEYLAGKLYQTQGLVGFAGLFLAAQVAHTLSISSTGFYSLIYKIATATTEGTGIRLNSKSKHVIVRILASVSTLISGCLIFTISGTSPLQTLLTGISAILGILLAMHLTGLFVPFANGRGVLGGSLCAFLLCSWISIGGLINSPGIGQPSPIQIRGMCNVTSFNGRYTLKDPDPIDNYQMPSQTAAAAAGAAAWQTPSPDELPVPPDLAVPPVEGDTNLMEESPSHIIVSGRPKTKQSSHKQVSSSSLPRSPVSSLTYDYLFGGSAKASTQQLASPSMMIQQQQQQQLILQQQQQQMSESKIRNMNPNIDRTGNKPPLILARPEEGSGDQSDFDQRGYGDQDSDLGTDVNFFYRISNHLYGLLAFILTIVFGLFFSALTNLCRSTQGIFNSVDPLLFHPIVRSLCCCEAHIHRVETKTQTEEEDLAQILTKVALERRKSMMIASIEEQNGLDRHGSIAGSFTGDLLRPIDANDAVSLSRRCSRHSRRSQRSSLGSTGQPGGAQVSTTAEVLVVPADALAGNDSSKEIQRKLSQLSDEEVSVVAAMSINELTRRNSNPPLSTPTLLQRQVLNQRGGSFRHTSSSSQNSSGLSQARSPRSPRFLDANGSQHFQLQPQPQQHLSVPSPGHPYPRPSLSPPQPTQVLLAPPSASQLAQRRFSEVDAAIERHNSRRQAKRSQSVMYRQNQMQGVPRRSRSKRATSDINNSELDTVTSARRLSRVGMM